MGAREHETVDARRLPVLSHDAPLHPPTPSPTASAFPPSPKVYLRVQPHNHARHDDRALYVGAHQRPDSLVLHLHRHLPPSLAATPTPERGEMNLRDAELRLAPVLWLVMLTLSLSLSLILTHSFTHSLTPFLSH